MKTKTIKINLQSSRKIEFIDITDNIESVIKKSGMKEGQALIFSPHTSAGIVLNHGEKMLLQDMANTLNRLVPVDRRYAHDMFELSKGNSSDGRSNGHSHCKNLLLRASETVIFEAKKLILGENQGIFFVELDGERKRNFYVQIIGN